MVPAFFVTSIAFLTLAVANCFIGFWPRQANIHRFDGFEPVSLARQGDLVRIATGGVRRDTQFSLDDATGQLASLPVSILSIPAFEDSEDSSENEPSEKSPVALDSKQASERSNANASKGRENGGPSARNKSIPKLPTYADWSQIPIVIGKQSQKNPYGDLSQMDVKNLYIDSQVSQDVCLSKDNNIWSLSNDTDTSIIKKATVTNLVVGDEVLQAAPAQDSYVAIGTQIENIFLSAWWDALDGKAKFGATDSDLEVKVTVNDQKTKVEFVQYGQKAALQVPNLAKSPYARTLVKNLRLNDDEHNDNVACWLSGEGMEAAEKVESDPVEDARERFPFKGTCRSALAAKHKNNLTLLWYDSKNTVKKIDYGFCVQLSYVATSWWEKKITAKYFLLSWSGDEQFVTRLSPDEDLLLYHSWGFCWNPCYSNINAKQIADRFFPYYEQAYRSEHKTDHPFKSPLTEEANRVRRWIEASIQDQLYFQPDMEGKEDFDPLNADKYPPLDRAIQWARRVNGSDWWGLIQVSILTCFLYPLSWAAIGYRRKTLSKGTAQSTWDKLMLGFAKKMDCAKHLAFVIAKQTSRNAQDLRFRFATRAMPLLGFIGTVIGISNSLAGAGNILSEKLADRQAVISEMTQDLATAFDTTFIGLAGAIALLCIEKFGRRKFVD